MNYNFFICLLIHYKSINNSSLYRQEGITLNEGWGVQYTVNCLLDDTNVLKIKVNNYKK